MRTIQLALLTIGATALAACAGQKPPQELVNARQAYNNAAASNAATLAPDDLYAAKKKLNEAERAFDKDENSEKARSKAYVAERAAMLAQARAATREAQVQVSQAAAARVEMLEQQRDVAQMNLQETRDELRRIRQSSDRNLQERQRQLEAREQELAAAEQARQQAEREASAALESLKNIADLREESRGTVITFPGTLLFPTAQSSVRQEAQERLDRVAQALEGTDRQIIVEGHTDSVGSEEDNQELSQERADSVRDYLIGKGIPEDRIRAVGHGESQPLAPNDTPTNRALNRRVEIVLERPGMGPMPGSTSPEPSTTEGGMSPGQQWEQETGGDQ